MNTTHKLSLSGKSARLLAAAVLLLASVAGLLAAKPAHSFSETSNTQAPGDLRQLPAPRATPLQPDCQALPECDYIQSHNTGQSLAGGAPTALVAGPVLTPACDELPECGYIRAHIPSNVEPQP